MNYVYRINGDPMKKLKNVLLIILIIIFFVPLIACNNGSDSSKKTTEPSSSSRYKNIFYMYSSDFSGYMTAKKVVIYNDLSAVISYTVANKTVDQDKEKIIKAIDNINKDIYSANDYKLYDKGNRVLYIESESFTEETVDNKTNVNFDIYFTNINYACTYYKMNTLNEYIDAENKKNSTSSQNKTYYRFIDTAGKTVNISAIEKQENYNVFVLENYVSSTEITFIFEGQIIAFLSPDNKGYAMDNNKLTITPYNSSSQIAVMYQASKNPVNWYILGPIIGVCSVFIILLAVRLIIMLKKPKAKKTKRSK